MPLAKIKKSWSASQKKEIMKAAHSTMQEALKIPENERNIRFHEYHLKDSQVPP